MRHEKAMIKRVTEINLINKILSANAAQLINKFKIYFFKTGTKNWKPTFRN